MGVIFEFFLNLWRFNQVFAQKVDFGGKKVAFYSNLPKVALYTRVVFYMRGYGKFISKPIFIFFYILLWKFFRKNNILMSLYNVFKINFLKNLYIRIVGSTSNSKYIFTLQKYQDFSIIIY